jgi:hypothetical protein
MLDDLQKIFAAKNRPVRFHSKLQPHAGNQMAVSKKIAVRNDFCG